MQYMENDRTEDWRTCVPINIKTMVQHFRSLVTFYLLVIPPHHPLHHHLPPARPIIKQGRPFWRFIHVYTSDSSPRCRKWMHGACSPCLIHGAGLSLFFPPPPHPTPHAPTHVLTPSVTHLPTYVTTYLPTFFNRRPTHAARQAGTHHAVHVSHASVFKGVAPRRPRRPQEFGSNAYVSSCVYQSLRRVCVSKRPILLSVYTALFLLLLFSLHTLF